MPNNNSFTQLSTVFETLFKHPPSEHARVLTEKYSKLIKLDPVIQEHPAFLHIQKSINNPIDIHSSFLQAQKLSGLNFLEQYSGVSERNSFLATILSYECYTQKIMKLKLIDIIKEIDISDTAEQIPNHPYLINYIGRFIKTTILENKEASALEIKSTPFYRAAVSLIQNLQERPEEFATLIDRINQGVENPIFSQIIKVIFTKQILLDIQLKIAPHLESISDNQHLSLLVNTYIAFLSYTLPNTSDAANEAEGHFALNQIFYQSAAFLLNDSDPDVAAFINELYFISIGHNELSREDFNPSCAEGAAERFLLYMHQKQKSLEQSTDYYQSYRSVFYSFFLEDHLTPSRFINSLLVDVFTEKKLKSYYYPCDNLNITDEQIESMIQQGSLEDPILLEALTELYQPQLHSTLPLIRAHAPERVEKTKIRIIAHNIASSLLKNSPIRFPESAAFSIFIDFLKANHLIVQKEVEIVIKKDLISFDHFRKRTVEKNHSSHLYELFKLAILEKKIIPSYLFDFIFSCFFIPELGFSKNSIIEFFYGDNQWIDSLIYRINQSAEMARTLLHSDYKKYYFDFEHMQDELHLNVISHWEPNQGLLRLLKPISLSDTDILKIFNELSKLPADRLIFNLIDYLSDDLASQCYLTLSRIDEQLIQSKFIEDEMTLTYITRAQNTGMRNFIKAILSTINTINSLNIYYQTRPNLSDQTSLIEHFIRNAQNTSQYLIATLSNKHFDHSILINSVPLIDYILNELASNKIFSYVKALNLIAHKSDFNDLDFIERNPLFVNKLNAVLEASRCDTELSNQIFSFIQKIFKSSNISKVLSGEIPIIFDLLEPGFFYNESFFDLALELISKEEFNVHMTLTGEPIRSSSSILNPGPVDSKPNFSLLNYGLLRVENIEHLTQFILTIINHSRFRGFSSKWDHLDSIIIKNEKINLDILVHKFLSKIEHPPMNKEILFAKILSVFNHPAIKSFKNDHDESIEHALLSSKSFDLKLCQKFYEEDLFSMNVADIQNDNLLHFIIKKIASCSFTQNKLINALNFLIQNNYSLLFKKNDFHETPLSLILRIVKNEQTILAFIRKSYQVLEQFPFDKENFSKMIISAPREDELTLLEKIILSKYFDLSNYVFSELSVDDMPASYKHKLVELILSGITTSLPTCKKMICSKLLLQLGYNEEGEELSLDSKPAAIVHSQMKFTGFMHMTEALREESSQIQRAPLIPGVSSPERPRTPERRPSLLSSGVSPNSAFTPVPKRNPSSEKKRAFSDTLTVAFERSLLFEQTPDDLSAPPRIKTEELNIKESDAQPERKHSPKIPFPSF